MWLRGGRNLRFVKKVQMNLRFVKRFRGWDESSVRSEVILPDDLFANAHQRRSLLACLLNSYKGLRENVGR